MLHEMPGANLMQRDGSDGDTAREKWQSSYRGMHSICIDIRFTNACRSIARLARTQCMNCIELDKIAH